MDTIKLNFYNNNSTSLPINKMGLLPGDNTYKEFKRYYVAPDG